MILPAARKIRIATAAAALIAASAMLVPATSADPGIYYRQGTVGPTGDIGANIGCYTNQITVFEIDVMARQNGDIGHPITGPDGSYTVGIGSGGRFEWTAYRVHLYRLDSGRWNDVYSGHWYARWAGALKFESSSQYWQWWDLALNRYVQQAIDKIPTASGSRYALQVEYYWWPNSDFPSGYALSWRLDPC